MKLEVVNKENKKKSIYNCNVEYKHTHTHTHTYIYIYRYTLFTRPLNMEIIATYY